MKEIVCLSTTGTLFTMVFVLLLTTQIVRLDPGAKLVDSRTDWHVPCSGARNNCRVAGCCPKPAAWETSFHI
jgi:hypothetical protein